MGEWISGPCVGQNPLGPLLVMTLLEEGKWRQSGESPGRRRAAGMSSLVKMSGPSQAALAQVT